MPDETIPHERFVREVIREEIDSRFGAAGPEYVLFDFSDTASFESELRIQTPTAMFPGDRVKSMARLGLYPDVVRETAYRGVIMTSISGSPVASSSGLGSLVPIDTPIEVIALVQPQGLGADPLEVMYGDDYNYTSLVLIPVGDSPVRRHLGMYTYVENEPGVTNYVIRVSAATPFDGPDATSFSTIGMRIDGANTSIYLNGHLCEWDENGASLNNGDPYDWVTGMPIGVYTPALSLNTGGGFGGYFDAWENPAFVSGHIGFVKAAILPIFDTDEARIAYCENWLSGLN